MTSLIKTIPNVNIIYIYKVVDRFRGESEEHIKPTIYIPLSKVMTNRPKFVANDDSNVITKLSDDFLKMIQNTEKDSHYIIP